MRTLVQWNCDECHEPPGFYDQVLVVIPHFETGFLHVVRWEDGAIIPVDGFWSVICPDYWPPPPPPVPVEETTWGRVKALFE